jgi:hypothetical protein
MSAHYDSEENPYGYYDGDDDAPRDEESWTCAFPGHCLMAYADHMRDECHTVEMLEAYYREVEGVGE